MSHRVIATQNRTIYEADGVTPIVILLEDQEVISTDETLKEALLMWGWAKLYDDTKPFPPRGINLYEDGMVYEGKWLVIKANALYQTKSGLVDNKTSSTWVVSEWDLILQGV